MFGHFARTARVAASLAGMAIGAALVLAATMVIPAHADRRGHAHGGIVTAESHFGNGTVSGSVRERHSGLEVQLPGGTWVDCGRSCSDTLRRQSVDFWQNQPGGPDRGRGYLSWGRTF